MSVLIIIICAHVTSYQKVLMEYLTQFLSMVIILSVNCFYCFHKNEIKFALQEEYRKRQVMGKSVTPVVFRLFCEHYKDHKELVIQVCQLLVNNKFPKNFDLCLKCNNLKPFVRLTCCNCIHLLVGSLLQWAILRLDLKIMVPIPLSYCCCVPQIQQIS